MKTSTTLSLICALFFTGCQTGPDGTSTAIPTAARMAGAITRIGASYDMQQHPDHRAAYEVAALALTRLVDASNWDAKEFAAVLAKLPVKQLQGSQGALLVQGTVLLWDLMGQTLFDPTSPNALKAMITAVRDGLNQALGPASAVLIRSKPPESVIPKNARRVRL